MKDINHEAANIEQILLFCKECDLTNAHEEKKIRKMIVKAKQLTNKQLALDILRDAKEIACKTMRSMAFGSN